MDDFEKREREAGLFLSGNDTMSGRAPIQSKIGRAEDTATRGSFETQGKIAEPGKFGTQGRIAEAGKFGTQGRLAGEPKPQRDSEDGIETVEIRRLAAAPSNAHDFQLLGRGTDTLTIRRGYANSDLAEISGTPLAIDPADNELTFTATGDTEFWLTYTSTGGDLDDPASTKTLTIVSTDPGADSATEANKPLGSVSADSGVLTVVNSHLTGSQDVESCGSSHTWRRS